MFLRIYNSTVNGTNTVSVSQCQHNRRGEGSCVNDEKHLFKHDVRFQSLSLRGASVKVRDCYFVANKVAQQRLLWFLR